MKFITAKVPMINLFRLTIEKGIDLNQLCCHPAICITGTDTGIGKTVVTGLLAKELSRKKSVITQKWVQAGDLDHPDIEIHDQLSGAMHHANPDRQVVSLKTAASPHLAAAIDDTRVDQLALISATKRLIETYDMVLVETSGGIMVPLNEEETFGDVIANMALPTIVVVPNKLGTINHTLLTIHYLKSKKIPIIGLILNQIEKDYSIIHDNNPKTIQIFSKMPIIATCLQVKNSIDRSLAQF